MSLDTPEARLLSGGTKRSGLDGVRWTGRKGCPGGGFEGGGASLLTPSVPTVAGVSTRFESNTRVQGGKVSEMAIWLHGATREPWSQERKTSAFSISLSLSHVTLSSNNTLSEIKKSE
jgi:hypothetical protein